MGGKEVGGLDQGGLRVHHVDAGIVAFVVSHDQTGIRMSAKALQHGGQGAGATLAPHPAQLASLVSFIWVSICVPPLPSAVLRLIDRFIARWGYPDDLFRLFRGHGGGNLAPPQRTQVPQLLLRFRGTGMARAERPWASQSFLQRIAPKWE